MTKFIFLVAILISSLSASAQIQISQQKTVGLIRNGNSEDVLLTKSEQSITLKYMGITSDRRWDTDFVKFQGGDIELNQLYDAFIQVLDSPDKNSSINITFGENNVLFIEKTKLMGVSYVTFGNGKTKTRQLNKSQISKLFGKN